jgi:hypothetical protein
MDGQVEHHPNSFAEMCQAAPARALMPGDRLG